MGKVTQPVVITPPEKLRAAVGEEAANEIVQMVVQVAASAASDKVSKSEYDAHARLIDEKFERFRAEVKNMINAALLKGLAWVTVLIFGLFGALWALVSTIK